MMVRVIIEPINKLISEQTLPCSYQYNSKHRMLVEDDSYADYDTIEHKDKPRPYERTITFNKNRRIVEYKYETDQLLQTENDKKIEMAIRIFWANHPLLVVNGTATKFTKHAMFNIINFTDESINKIKVWRDKLAVCTKINELSYQDKVNISYFYGENPQGKTENDLVLSLANFENGICLRDSEMDNFKRIWIKGDHSDKDIVINARKALALSIIEERQYEGKNSYYLGETFVGTAFPDIIAYCKREEKIYNDFIVRQIESKEDFSAEKKESLNTIPNVKPQELDALKTEAELLKKEGFIWKALSIENASFETLTKHVSEGRLKKKNKKEIAQPA